ncbi:hypothetical protein FGO68_gene5326 [Halteria grandinella]|uniref:RING finger protein 141 n=1 Tax=Halteria grandinella TaxID=5974 RepID=A0A8J8T109_HALGN|nr:hypothetical protein FGO68_gene5326 [Halteria grandinella]
MVDFEKFLLDVHQLNRLFEDRRYQRKIGFKITLEIATTSIPIIKLLKTQLWKNSSMVKVVATVKECSGNSSILGHSKQNCNETINHLISQIREEGSLKKKMSAEKFYFLYYQMTELIPLFSYLERLNAFKCSVMTTIGGGEDEDQFVDAVTPTQRTTNMFKIKRNGSEKDGEIRVEFVQPQGGQLTPQPDSIGECSVCLDSLSDVMLPCLHAFCNHCIVLWQAKQSNCPVCRSEILTKMTGMTQIQGTGVENEFFCIINSGDSIEEMADEINMRVSAATRFILDSKSYTKMNKVFSNRYTVEQLQTEIEQQIKQNNNSVHPMNVHDLEELESHHLKQPWVVEGATQQLDNPQPLSGGQMIEAKKPSPLIGDVDINKLEASLPSMEVVNRQVSYMQDE